MKQTTVCTKIKVFFFKVCNLQSEMWPTTKTDERSTTYQWVQTYIIITHVYIHTHISTSVLPDLGATTPGAAMSTLHQKF